VKAGSLADFRFAFNTDLVSGETYDVTIGAQPIKEICTVTHNTGTVGTGNVTSVEVTCK
jgi:hypothetical protein